MRLPRLLAACCLGAGLLTASPLYASPLSGTRMDDALTQMGGWGREMADDALSISAQPAHWQTTGWTRLGAVALGTALLYQYDGPINRRLAGPDNRLARFGSNIGNPLGDARLLIPVLGLTAYAAHRADNPVILGTAGRAAEAAVLAAGASLAGKLALGRHRPDGGDNAHTFSGPGLHNDREQSLPSGHTATAFAVASVVAERHRAAAPIAYGAATLTAYARMAKNRHWASDVFTGAVLGLWIGHSVAHRHRLAGDNRRPKIALTPANGGLILSLNWTR